MFIFVYSDFESFFRTYFALVILLSSDFCFIFFFIYKGYIGVRRSGALALRPGPIVWRHKITDAPPAKRRSICSDHIFVARIGVLIIPSSLYHSG